MATSWHLTSLTVLGGTLHGKKLTIEDVVVEVLIGSDSDCHLHIDLPTVSPIHARLWIEPDDVTVYGTRSGPGVFVNLDRIEGEGKIRPGDLLWLGPPQEPGSVMLQVHFEERDTLPPVVLGSAYDDPLALEPMALTDTFGTPEPASVEAEAEPEVGPEAEGEAEPQGGHEADAELEPEAGAEAEAEPEADTEPEPAETEDEALGVLPEDDPEELSPPVPLAQRVVPSEPRVAEESLEPSLLPVSDPLPESQASAEDAMALLSPPSPEPPPPGGFDDFLVMDSAAPAALSTADADEFGASGFEAEWPEAPEAQAVAVEVSEPAVADDRPDPGPLPPVVEDVFFVDDGAQPPPIGPASEDEDSFFIDDGSLGSAPVTAPAPAPSPVPDPSAEIEDLSFAAGFLEEPSSKPPVPSKPPALEPRSPAIAPPAVAKPVASPPFIPKPASAPPAAAPSPAKASATPAPAAPLASRSPSATNAVRPLPRGDASQSGSRGARPLATRPDRTQPVRPRRPAGGPLGRYAAIGVIALVVIGGVWFAVSTLMRRVVLERVDPPRARVGETVALVGRGFSSTPVDNAVLFDDKLANVSTATPTRLEVVVPDVAAPGADVRARVRVRVGRAESPTVEVAVYSGPILHGISPDVAMPGDEVVLAGSSWGLGPTVRFGGVAGEVLEAKETSIRVRVPAIDGGPGTAAPVVVVSGSLESNAGPFYVGRIPLVTKAEPTSVSPGDVVTLSGRGFRRERSQNAVQVGGVRALVVAAFDNEIKVVVPRVPAGSRMLEVRVPSSAAPAQVPLVVGGAPDILEFHFVAEPFAAVPGRDHAVLTTKLGPAFVLASSGGRSAAERAQEAARRLNDAAPALKASSGLTFDLRDADRQPSLGLAGRPEVIVEVTEEDAAAYGEDWTGLRGRGGPVTAGRLGRWWEAVAKDLALLLVRGEKPHFAVDLAPEGRVLVDLFQAAQRGTGGAQAKAPDRDALRLVALRVPPGVRGPVMAAPSSQPTAAALATPPSAASQPMPRLDGPWTGSESEGGRQRYVTVTFRGSTGTIAYEGVMTVSAPLLSVAQPQKGSARFSVELRGGLRYYVGRWDGQALAGKISSDPSGSQNLGTFELRPR